VVECGFLFISKLISAVKIQKSGEAWRSNIMVSFLFVNLIISVANV
jgi:hypothetical protein